MNTTAYTYLSGGVSQQLLLGIRCTQYRLMSSVTALHPILCGRSFFIKVGVSTNVKFQWEPYQMQGRIHTGEHLTPQQGQGPSQDTL